MIKYQLNRIKTRTRRKHKSRMTRVKHRNRDKILTLSEGERKFNDHGIKTNTSVGRCRKSIGNSINWIN